MSITIDELRKKVNGFRSITPWENVEVRKAYHIPTLLNLPRRDIVILSKDNSEASYRKIGSEEVRKMKRTSLFAKFLVKRKKF